MSRSRTIFVGCACLSIAIHILALLLLSQSRIPASQAMVVIHPLEKQQAILAEAFAHCVVDGVKLHPLSEQKESSLGLPHVPASPIQQVIASAHTAPLMPLPFSPKIHLDLFDTANEVPFFALYEEKSLLQGVRAFTPETAETHVTIRLSAPTPSPQESFPQPAQTAASIAPLKFPTPRPESLPPMAAHWPQLPTLRDLQTISCSEFFDVDLSCIPLDDEKFFFVLTLVPHEDLPIPKLKQNYLFLIDRSNSIQKERLEITKQALYKVVEQLPKEDTFQIFSFDSRVDKCAPSALTPQPTSLAQAKGFIDRIELGSFFSQADLSLPLLLAVPGRVADNELYTAILFTDGESLKKRDHGLGIFHEWMVRSGGNITLYTIAQEGDSALATLDAASVLSRGKLVSYSGKWSLKRKLLKLMKGIENPVAKELACSAISTSANGSITLYPEAEIAPSLYQGQPYVLFGVANSLDDFILFVQGRFQDRWVNIKKRVSFLTAKKGGNSLRNEWALQTAYRYYAAYLRQGNPAQLAEARALLQTHHIPVAFE